jgi:hypothetical protein
MTCRPDVNLQIRKVEAVMDFFVSHTSWGRCGESNEGRALLVELDGSSHHVPTMGAPMRLYERLLSVLGRIRQWSADQIDEQAINDACTQVDY